MRRSLALPFATLALSLLVATAALAQASGVQVSRDPKTGFTDTTQPGHAVKAYRNKKGELVPGHIKQSSWEQMHPRRKNPPRPKTTKMKTHTIKPVKVAKAHAKTEHHKSTKN